MSKMVHPALAPRNRRRVGLIFSEVPQRQIGHILLLVRAAASQRHQRRDAARQHDRRLFVGVVGEVI